MTNLYAHLLRQTGRILLGAALLAGFSAPTQAETQKSKKKATAPVFLDFTYEGQDRVYQQNPLNEGEFYNMPILQGCYPDPSICRKGEDYYLINSSFAMFPGVPIFTSKDLVNWRQVGHVLDRPSQLKTENCGISAGIYAPTIRYNKYNDTFYMITTQICGGIGNMVVKTKDPAKGWSDPIKLDFAGIDPDLFFDEDGKAYLLHNDGPDKGKELYNGHRVIKMWDYDVEKDCVVPGTDRIIVDGGTDITKKPIWIEGPHLYKYRGAYYLMCAQGGTGGNHTEVIFKAESLKGPFVPAANNPILTQMFYRGKRPFRVDWAGHADLVDTPDGRFYGVFLAIRPNEKEVVNTGRETYLLPVDWTGEWPVFQNGLVPFEPKLKLPAGVTFQGGQDGFLPNGNFIFKTDFLADYSADKALDARWISMRGPREAFIAPAKKGGLQINPLAEDITARRPISALLIRQQHACFTAETSLRYVPKNEGEIAGLTCYQAEFCNFVLGLTKKDGAVCMVLQKVADPKTKDKKQAQAEVVASVELTKEQVKALAKQPLRLQVVARDCDYAFSYALPGQEAFTQLGETQNGEILSTNFAGGFTGSLLGIYARQ